MKYYLKIFFLNIITIHFFYIQNLNTMDRMDKIGKFFSKLISSRKTNSPQKNQDKTNSPKKNQDKTNSPQKNQDKTNSPQKNQDKTNTTDIKIFSLAIFGKGPCNPTLISDYQGLKKSIQHVGNFFNTNNAENRILENQSKDEYLHIKQHGESCELALYIENYIKEKKLSLSSYIFATGEISEDGRIQTIGGIIPKIIGAYHFINQLNINENSYLLIPLKNKSIAEETIKIIKEKEEKKIDLKVFYVENTKEVNNQLNIISKKKKTEISGNIFHTEEEPFQNEDTKTLFLKINNHILNKILKQEISIQYFFETFISFIAAKKLNNKNNNNNLIKEGENTIIEIIIGNDLLENFLNLATLLLFDKKEALESTSQKVFILELIEKLVNQLNNKQNIFGIESYIKKINQFLTICNYYSNFIESQNEERVKNKVRQIKEISILNYNKKNEDLYNDLIKELTEGFFVEKNNSLSQKKFYTDSFTEFQDHIKTITIDLNQKNQTPPLTTQLIEQFKKIQYSEISAIEKFTSYQKENNLEETYIFKLNDLLYGYQISEEEIDRIIEQNTFVWQDVLTIFNKEMNEITAEYLKIKNNSLDLDHIFNIILQQVQKKDAMTIWATFIDNIKKGFITLDAPLYKQAYKKFLLNFLNSDNLSIEEDLFIAQYCLESIQNIKSEKNNSDEKGENNDSDEKGDLVSLYSTIFSILIRKNEKNTFFILDLFYQASQVITHEIPHGTIFWKTFFKEHFFTKNTILNGIIVKKIILTIINKDNKFCFNELVKLKNENNDSFILQFLVDAINKLSLEDQLHALSFFENQAIQEINTKDNNNYYLFDILFLFSRNFLQNKNAANNASTLYTQITLENGYEKNLTYDIKKMFLESFVSNIFHSMIEKNNLVEFLENNKKSDLLSYDYLLYFYDTKILITIISKLQNYSFYPIYRLNKTINENKRQIEKGIEDKNMYLHNYFYRLEKISSQSQSAKNNILKITKKEDIYNNQLKKLLDNISNLDFYLNSKKDLFNNILKEKGENRVLSETLLESTQNKLTIQQ